MRSGVFKTVAFKTTLDVRKYHGRSKLTVDIEIYAYTAI